MENRNKMNGKNSTIFIIVLLISCIALGFNYLKLRRNLDDTFDQNIKLGQNLKSRDLKLSSYEQELQFGKDMLKEAEGEKIKLKGKIQELENTLAEDRESLQQKETQLTNAKQDSAKFKIELENTHNDLKNMKDEQAALNLKIEELTKQNSELLQKYTSIQEVQQKQKLPDIENNKNDKAAQPGQTNKEVNKDAAAQNQGQAPPAADVGGGENNVPIKQPDLIGNDEEDVQLEHPPAVPV